MIKFFVIIGIAASQFTIVPVLYSQYTSPFMVNYFKSTLDCSDLNDERCKIASQFRFKVYEVSDSSDLDSIFMGSDTIVMYDGCASLGLTTLINEYARKLGFLQLIIGYASEKTLPYVFYTDYSYKSYVNAALSIAKTYKIEKAIAIISSEFSEMDFSNNEGVEIVAQLIISQAATYEYIIWLFSKKLKLFGVKLFYFKTNPEISKLIQKALVEADMNKEDYLYIYMQEAAWSAYIEGSMLLEGKWFHSTDIFNYIDNLVYWGSVIVGGLLADNPVHGSYSGYFSYKWN
ncbi:unnamed protein product [Blepharisma stoltei]|uniref:Receptor ligand binding region domain-containing protein n=1 Tax=Blepharisma stoltei TaxID=1481888 RepID=A0AAU9JLA6_9CILI|nr:unnamed protein product [Blepharisma stoltei]